jgi:DNA-binding NtrC family response regulator
MEWQACKVIRTRSGKRILVVEDDEQVRVLVHHVLLSAGFEVDSVSTMASALVHLESHAYHLVLTDDRLPDGRGVRLAAIAKEKGMDAVVLTGYMLQSTSADLDAHEHLMKPVRPDELVQAIERHMAGNKRADRS